MTERRAPKPTVSMRTEPERRKQIVRRRINEAAAKAPGAEEKAFAVAIKAAMLWIFINKTDEILGDWTLLLIFIFTFLAPDMLKRLAAAKTGTGK